MRAGGYDGCRPSLAFVSSTSAGPDDAIAAPPPGLTAARSICGKGKNVMPWRVIHKIINSKLIMI
jgi:hypothetical protein